MVENRSMDRKARGERQFLCGLLFVGLFLFLDRHVLQFTGLENIPTLLTFHIFGFVVARDDLHSRVLALFRADFLWGGSRRLARRHKRGRLSKSRWEIGCVPEFPNILRRLAQDVKYRQLSFSYHNRSVPAFSTIEMSPGRGSRWSGNVDHFSLLKA